MAEDDFGWKLVSWLWERRDAITQKLQEIYAWFRGSGSSSSGILVLGPGGTGKTTLAKLLAGEYNGLLDTFGEYAESLDIERYSLKEDPGIEIVVPPGQEDRRAASWADLHKDIAAGKFRGIILLAAYGYHNLGRVSYKNHKLYNGNKEEFLARYLEDRRREELSILGQLAPHVQVNRGKMWMLTVISKQDLWWPQRQDVEKYYREGPYRAETEKVIRSLNPRQFRQESAFASLVINNFTSGADEHHRERLRPNAEGYDHPLQIQSLRRLFEIADALKNWEAG